MKKIVLIGDSIRIGYEKYVQEALEGSAEFYIPNDNAKFTTYVLRFIQNWKKKGQWPEDVDLIHWNAGLWDVVQFFNDPEPLTPIDCYEKNIARIDKRLRHFFPKAKMIFATSTAVVEEGYLGTPGGFRTNAMIEAYNEAAKRALAGTDTIINDLYAITKDCPDSCRSDMTHFATPEGTALLGNQVLSVLCNALDISASEIKLEDFVLAQHSEDYIGF